MEKEPISTEKTKTVFNSNQVNSAWGRRVMNAYFMGLTHAAEPSWVVDIDEKEAIEEISNLIRLFGNPQETENEAEAPMYHWLVASEDQERTALLYEVVMPFEGEDGIYAQYEIML